MTYRIEKMEDFTKNQVTVIYSTRVLARALDKVKEISMTEPEECLHDYALVSYDYKNREVDASNISDLLDVD